MAAKAKKKAAAAASDKLVPVEQSKFERYSGALYLGLAFFIPFAMMFVCFAVAGVQPFGNNQILVTDLWHQYYPFLVDFHDKLQHGGSMLWTWRSGGGTNYIPLMAYYLASPLNFFSILVPPSGLKIFLFVITCVKIGLAGLFFALFLKITFKRNDAAITAFGIMYALCAFIMGYYWNVIWLDTIALLPLVIAGTFALLRDGKFRLYVITLALSILANYYIGLFTCIFIFLVALGYVIVEFKGWKDMIMQFLKMLGASVLGLMMSAVFILPVYFALGYTHSSDNTFPKQFAVNMGVTPDFAGVLNGIGKTIANSVAFTQPTAKEGLPNVYCGVFTIFLAILFLFCTKIKKRERIYCGGLLLFFVLSFIIRQLDYIWHGFHFPNMLPHRFSFLYSFVLIYMAFRVFMYIGEIKPAPVIASILVFAIYLGMASAYYDNDTVKLSPIFTNKNVNPVLLSGLIGIVVAAGVLIVSFKLFKNKKTASVFISTLLVVVAMGEGMCSAAAGVKTVGVTDALSYPLGGKETLECVEYVDQLEENNIDLPRTEVNKYHTLNDTALIGADGISMFSSMVNRDVTSYMEKFGLCGWVASNRFTYQEGSPFTNLMLNLKYIIAPYGAYLDQTHNELIYQRGNVKLMQNKYYLPQGFMVKSDLLNYNVEAAPKDPFDNQNQIFRMVTGLEGDVYEYLDPTSFSGETEGATVTNSSPGTYNYNATNDSNAYNFTYTAPRDGVAMAYFTSANETDNISIRVNGSETIGYYIKRPFIMMVGTVHKGDAITLHSTVSGTAGTITSYCTMLNEDLFTQGYNKLGESTMSATKVTDTAVEGTITAKEDGLFYTSIPYSKGWKAYVDGVETEITPVGKVMTAFKLSAGTHKIELHYMPEGFIPGLICTVVAILIFVGLILFQKKKGKLVKADSANEKTEEPKTE